MHIYIALKYLQYYVCLCVCYTCNQSATRSFHGTRYVRVCVCYKHQNNAHFLQETNHTIPPQDVCMYALPYNTASYKSHIHIHKYTNTLHHTHAHRRSRENEAFQLHTHAYVLRTYKDMRKYSHTGRHEHEAMQLYVYMQLNVHTAKDWN